MSTLEQAIAIAAAAHSGAKDKAGEPYILHPLRVMLAMTATSERIVAVLHDVIEDSEWTLAALAERGFSSDVLTALDALTRKPEEAYEAFIQRAGSNSIARRVKIADLRDNLDRKRLPEVTGSDRARLAKYRRALAALAVDPGGRSAN